MRTLEITTVKSCPINCLKYCPQDVFRKKYQAEPVLTYSFFERALHSVPKDVCIDFSGFSEPFLNKEVIDMIEYATKAHEVRLFTTLTGLTPEGILRLEKYRFKLVCLHLPDNQHVAKIPLTEIYKDTLVRALTRLNAPITFVAMNENFQNNYRAGNIQGHNRHIKGPIYCNKLKEPQFVMLPDCSVVLCCMDFGLKHFLGNLLENSYDEIVETSYLEIQKQAKKRNTDLLCRNCNFALTRKDRMIYSAYSWLKKRFKIKGEIW